MRNNGTIHGTLGVSPQNGPLAVAALLDFGCGPGRYAIPAGQDRRGRRQSLDTHPLAISVVESEAKSEELANVSVIHSGCATGLEDQSVDAVLLFDAFHDVEDKEVVLQECRRVLRPKGRLLYKDHALNGL